MKQKGVSIDVETEVERPHIYIFARSSSTLEDQASFHECRRECLTDLQTELRMTGGIPYQDVVRFFHGDGPAQQVEAGAKMGGTYPCVGCTARCSMFDDVAYSFRAKKHSIADRDICN